MRLHRGGRTPKCARIASDEDGWRRAPTPTNQKLRYASTLGPSGAFVDGRWARVCACCVPESFPSEPIGRTRHDTGSRVVSDVSWGRTVWCTALESLLSSASLVRSQYGSCEKSQPYAFVFAGAVSPLAPNVTTCGARPVSRSPTSLAGSFGRAVAP